jgi:hypothetical protein
LLRKTGERHDKYQCFRITWTAEILDTQGHTIEGISEPEHDQPAIRSSLGLLLEMLEGYKAELNLEYYSIGQNRLEDMFLRVIGNESGVLKEV